MARRGDRIRCTVLFQKKRDADGKIPVFFTLNGSEIILQRGESPESSLIFMDFKEPLFPFIGMTEGSSVLAKVRTFFRSISSTAYVYLLFFGYRTFYAIIFNSSTKICIT